MIEQDDGLIFRFDGIDAEQHRIELYVARKLKRMIPDNQADKPLTTLRIKKLFMENRGDIAEAAVEDMRKLDLVDSDDNLTGEALMWLRMELKRI